MSRNSASSAHSSVSDWIDSLKKGSLEAARKIWQRYVEQLVRAADQRLKQMPRRVLDGEDIAQEAFDRFFRGVKENRFSQIDDRHDLWTLLIMLADRRANDYMRRELAKKRGKGHVRGDSAVTSPGNSSASRSGGLDGLPGPQVTPASADGLIRLIQRIFPELGDVTLQQIALDRMANYSVAEIASRQGMPLRSAERKLDLIRQILEKAERDSQ